MSEKLINKLKNTLQGTKETRRIRQTEFDLKIAELNGVIRGYEEAIDEVERFFEKQAKDSSDVEQTGK